MRLALTFLTLAVLAAGCDRRSGTSAAPANDTPNTTVQGPPPREVMPKEAKPGPVNKLTRGIGGVFKPIRERSTDDLIAEVEHFTTQERLPLIAELATRTKDKARLMPVLNKQMLDGRYSVRVAAATARLALDPENASKHAVDLKATMGGKQQMPVYGPIQEDTPELRKIQALAVPKLAKILEEELATGGTYPQTGGCLSALDAMPAEIGKPALPVVKKIAGTAMNPNQLPAQQLLQKWGVS